MPVAEYIMTANRLPKDKNERIMDRIGVIVFNQWKKISLKEKSAKEAEVRL